VLFKDKNYFEIFSIPVSFQVDLKKLGEHYRELQSDLHPDRVAGGTEQEKLRAIQTTSLLNEAFETLEKPGRRAAYLLELQGIAVDQVNQADLGPEMLLEQIQLREELEELPRDESALNELERLRTSIGSRQAACEMEFSRSMEERDFDLAKKNYYEMQYFAKLVDEIDSLEEDLLGY